MELSYLIHCTSILLADLFEHFHFDCEHNIARILFIYKLCLQAVYATLGMYNVYASAMLAYKLVHEKRR